MRNGPDHPYVGYVAMAGGAMGLVLAPIMVIIKYMTGWAIIPEPMWVGAAQEALGGLLQFATPPGLWMAYGSVYTLALLLMLVGFVGLFGQSRDAQGRLQTKGYWIVLVGTVHGDSWRCDPHVDVAPEWTHHTDARHEPCGQHGVRGTHDGDELRHGRRNDGGCVRVAAEVPGAVAGVDVCADISVGCRGVHDGPSDDAKRCALVVQRDDDRVRVLPCHGKYDRLIAA